MAQDPLRILVVEPDAARAERARQVLADAGLGDGVEIVPDAQAAAAAIIPEHARGYRFLIDALPQVVWVSASDGNMLHGNPRFWEFTGATPGEPFDRAAWARLIHPDDLETFLADRARHLEAGRSWEYEVRLRRASNGTDCWHLVREQPIHDVDGTLLSWLGTAFDIDDVYRARAERVLLANVVASSDDAIVTKTLDGIVTSWNHGAERLFGYTAAEMVGQSITRLLPLESDATEILEILARIRDGQRIDHFETKRRHKDGHLLDVSLTISPLRDSTGRVIGASSIKRDVTEQHRARELLRNHAGVLEARVTERTHSLEEMVAEMDTFIYSVSHDLRAPLRAMQGYADALRDDVGEGLGPQGLDYLRQIGVSSRLMDRMITDLLTLSRMRHTAVEPTSIALPALVTRVLSGMEGELRQAGALVTVDAPDDTPEVLGHETTVLQVLQNLLTNAVKFRAPGTFPRIRIAAEAEPNLVRLWVEDRGIGIAPEHHHQIFRAFERLHRRDQFPGTGVGLAIAQKAVERLGGRIGVESAPGEGSRFWFELPRTHPSHSTPWEGAHSAAAS